MNNIASTTIDPSAPRKAYRKIIMITFPSEVSGSPMVCNLTRLYDLSVNILRASITPRRDGFMTVELFGDEEKFHEAISYLKGLGIKISTPDQSISRDEDSCMQCGMCIAICPSEALRLDINTRRVIFDMERCAACGMCTRVCPVKAMHIVVEQ
ncbi:(Fe-S)-binding protein [Oceanidesulfovibrio indonesiensis]|uniref:(Fe-S)-binding protein n=1 Tax=Oceanidesulfovibrio indonesiensis TaxID=54767 RepID=A0A7M3MH94_9BACT|nr:NIL domain-containing protein [Oceanidesulfovibrio indonesiensis]TVM18395.1 (Fe-S)-binding protein [Oceanidesulfovibrio indonesiensis]